MMSLAGPDALDAPAAPQDFVTPASFAQRRLWLAEQRHPGSAAYTMLVAWRIEGELDVAALTRAVDWLVGRHEALRTRFEMRDGELVQVIAMPRSRVLERVAVASSGDGEAAAAAFIEGEAGRVFDLEQGPLFAARLARLGDDGHVLALGLHHTVGDEESLSILAGELWRAYDAFAAGRTPALPPLDLQYPDFAAWQQAQLASAACEPALQYWETTLAGAPVVFDSPLARPGGAATGQGDWVGFALDEETSRDLVAAAEQAGASPFMLGAALFQLLLYRSSGEDDFLLGYPSTWRRRRELEGVVGMFVNMLMLRARTDGSASFATLLRGVREAVLAAQEHGDAPFEMVVERLAPERRPNRNPLFQVAYAFGAAGPTAESVGGLRVAPAAARRTTAKFDLTLYLALQGGRFTGGFEFDVGRFERRAVELLAARLRRLADAAARAPDCAVDRMPAIGPEERGLLERMARTGPAAAPGSTVVGRIEAQAAARPDGLALVCGPERLTYRELVAAAAGVQAALIAAAARSGEPVGVLIDPSLAMAPALLGVLRAGAAYVPLDPALPAARLAQLAEQLGLRIVLTVAATAEKVPAGIEQIVFVETCAPVTTPAEDLARPEGVAYLIHTSGSSGAPKPVAITHAALDALVGWHIAYHGLAPGEVATQLASPGFDACGWEIWACLCAGGALGIVTGEARRDPAALRRALSDLGARQAFMPTPLGQAFVSLAARSGGPPTLERLLVGGDRLAPLPPGNPGFAVYNHYGPTEATVVATAGRTDPDAPGAPPLGRPIAGTRIVLRGPRGEAVLLGAPGEICIAGAGVALGYWGRPRETAEAFAPDDGAELPGARLYRSGDLGRLRLDGQLEFLGRRDRQVKRNGVRIEPGEIEAALVRVDGVRAASVQCVAAAGGGPPRLVAVVAMSVTDDGLRARLADLLPAWLLPDAFVAVADLPLLPSGKPDQAALRALAEPASAAPAPQTPRTEIEAQLATIWAELLGCATPGPEDNFFELGGHSMLVIQLAGRIWSDFQVEIEVVRLFERPLLGQQHDYLAALLAGAESIGAVDDAALESGVL